MNASFRIFEQELTRLNEQVGPALADALQVDTAVDETSRAAAFALMLGDVHDLLQWLWMPSPALSPEQSHWMADLDEWMDRVNGEAPAVLSVQGRVRAWQGLLKSEGYIDQLQGLIEAGPRSLALLRDIDAIHLSAHAVAWADFLHQFARHALYLNATDWHAPAQRLAELERWWGLGSANAAARSFSPDTRGAGTGDAEAGFHCEPLRQNAGEQTAIGTDTDNPELRAALSELNALVGLEAVKSEVRSLVNLLRLNQLRLSRGLPSLDVTRHMVFYGSPGTGKTTVARLIARILKALGVLKKGHLVETDRSGLVAAYVGQTALKVKRAVNQADEGVLFIDEAYALARGENDFGSEAIETLLKLMEDRRDSLVVIVAGYTDRMQAFIQSNPGLKSRFTRYFSFDDYSPDQLCDVLQRICQKQGMTLTPPAVEAARTHLRQAAVQQAIAAGNARLVRNVFEKATMAQANRLARSGQITDAELMQLDESDLAWSLAETLRELG